MNRRLKISTLPNGLTIVHVARPGSGVVSFSLCAIAGSIYETPDEVGVAHFLEHIVSDGTKKYPDEKELAELIDGRGGIRNARTSRETVEYIVKMPTKEVEVAFDYLSQLILHPLIKKESVEKQKKIIEQEIYKFKSNPSQYAPRLIMSAVYPNTRAGGFITGDVEDVKKISREKVIYYLKKTHCGKNMVLSVCGDISQEDLKRLADQYFGQIPTGEKKLPIDNMLPLNDMPILENRSDINQATLTIGYQGISYNDPDRYATELLILILVKGKSSRLFHEIRQKEALAYAIGGMGSFGRATGSLYFQAGLLEENIQKCITLIKTELKSLTKNEISKEEINKSLALIESGYSFKFEDSMTEASFYSEMWCLRGKVNDLDKEIAHYRDAAVDLKTIKRVANRLFSSPPAILIIGRNTLVKKPIVW